LKLEAALFLPDGLAARRPRKDGAVLSCFTAFGIIEAGFLNNNATIFD
jgi:hypothetical protein